jgi:tRNA A-37 threonylcarbamoyl transferase component Bud32
MQLDSMFWQGLYKSNDANLNQPLLGIWDGMGRQTLAAVTDCVNLFEMKVINIIPFNYLTIDTSNFIAGGASRVYKGNCFQIDHIVAVKILFCMEITPERIVQFCDEATLLNSLSHPNIVTCYGVALMPPAISLVTEYCYYGSLYSFLHSYDVIRDSFRDDSYSNNNNNSNSNSNNNNNDQHQRVLRISDVSSISFPSSKLYDNTSSIGSKEHELSARTISSQIKDSLINASYSMSSANMMKRVEDAIGTREDNETVNGNLTNAKDFMTSKEMRFGLGPQPDQTVNRITITTITSNNINNTMHDISSNSKNSQHIFAGSSSKLTLGNFLPLDFKVKLCYECCSGIAYLHSKGFVHNDIKSLNFLVTRDLTVKLSDLGETRLSNTKIEAKELPTNINWSAPEVLNGNGQVHTSADIWGLSLVMYEILTGTVPFDLPEYRSLQLNEFALKLKQGLRPEIPQDIKEGKYKWIVPLIEQAWVYDANKRCSAEYLVTEFQQNLRS